MKMLGDIQVQDSAVVSVLTRSLNQIYKLLPLREEGEDWEKPLTTLTQTINGMYELLPQFHELLFLLSCKMKGLTTFKDPLDFSDYRRTIFECIDILSRIIKSVGD